MIAISAILVLAGRSWPPPNSQYTCIRSTVRHEPSPYLVAIHSHSFVLLIYAVCIWNKRDSAIQKITAYCTHNEGIQSRQTRSASELQILKSTPRPLDYFYPPRVIEPVVTMTREPYHKVNSKSSSASSLNKASNLSAARTSSDPESSSEYPVCLP